LWLWTWNLDLGLGYRISVKALCGRRRGRPKRAKSEPHGSPNPRTQLNRQTAHRKWTRTKTKSTKDEEKAPALDPATMAIKKSSSAADVLLYLPNIIGYLRVIFTVSSLILMICFPEHWIIAIILYLSSFVGDLLDGLVARKVNQCSTFGGLLDMVTDRCSTAGLLCVLSNEHSEQPVLVLVSRCRYIQCMIQQSIHSCLN